MKSYFQYLIWMMLFAIIIQMFFPDSSYRKYIKLVLGCILLYTMMTPLVKLIKVNGQDYEGYVKQYQMLLGGMESGGSSYEEALEEQRASIKEMYEESIKAYIEGQFEVSAYDVEVTWDEEELDEIYLTVGRKDKGEGIGTIRIGEKSETVHGDEEKLKNKMKTCLSDFYNVQVCNIHITVQKS